MLIDSNLLHLRMPLRANVCIVGTGIGALSVGNALLKAGHNVLFVEAGPLTTSLRDRPPIALENVGTPFGIGKSRGVEVGGGSMFWHGVCAPLDEHDFLRRPWIAHSGWPIQRGDLAQWYSVAEEFLCGQKANDLSTIIREMAVIGKGNKFTVKPFYYREKPFRGRALLQEWCKRGLARCVYNSTALKLHQSNGKAHTLVVGGDGGKFYVKADFFIIAAGALETPRLLLNSVHTTPHPLPGLSWWLGRNLIDHPTGYLSQLRFSRSFESEFRPEPPSISDVRGFPGFVLAPSLQDKHQLPNHTMFVRKGVSTRAVPTRAVMSFLGVRSVRDVSVSHLRSILHHPYIIWRIANQKLGIPGRSRFGDLFFMTEQLPNPHSRVTLSPRYVDRFGLPIARVNWNLTQQDVELFASYHALIMSLLGNCDEVQSFRADSLVNGESTLFSAAHHLGTARMGCAVEDGVVDRNLKVFGLDNVWICDGSVFPTAGSVNPSLTICALGHRLGNHLNHLC